MDSAPRVSVVVPAFQNASYLRATLESVLAQTFRDFELLVADHGSTDGTWAIMQEFSGDERVRLLRTPAGGGAERNWNRVTSEARGELVKLVCGDDLLAPGSLAAQVATFDSHRDAQDGGVAMVASARDIVDAAGRPVVREHGLGGLEGRVPGREAIRRSVVKGANIFGEPCCVLLRRTTLEAVGGWHGDPGFMIDQATYCRVLEHGDLAVAPGSLAGFRISSTQWSVSLAREQSRMAAEMHRQIAARVPGLLSPGDLRLGNARATLRAFQRRLVYLYLGRRMLAAPTEEP
ncbi:MAG: glycosyltransferase family 2 protein [Marmoricola sp.]|jgi:glycosyltransferase involved in cell wall biosynthesis|nr:glycosyltransferase family 2 protein [Marmoricola sp.]